MNIKKIFILILIIIFFSISLFSASNSIQKSETYYFFLDKQGNLTYNQNSSEKRFRMNLKWEKGKKINLLKLSNLKNLLSYYGNEEIVDKGNSFEITLTDNDYITLGANLGENFKCPLKFEFEYYFNGKKIDINNFFPDPNSSNPRYPNGTFEIKYKVINTTKINQKISYRKFPENKDVTENKEMIIPFFLLVSSSSYNIIDYDKVEVTSGKVLALDLNNQIQQLLFPYPSAEASIKFTGKIKNLPRLTINAMPVSYDIPTNIYNTIFDIDDQVIDTFESYQELKKTFNLIIETEEQIIDIIDEYYNLLTESLPKLTYITDLTNLLFIGNLERVIKLNNLFIDILDDLKDYIGIDSALYKSIEELFQLNNNLIKMILEGATVEGVEIPGMYDIPGLIDDGRTYGTKIEEVLVKFKDGISLIKNKMVESKVLIESYEYKVFKVINDARINQEKINRMMILAKNFNDLSLKIMNIPNNVTIESSLQMSFIIDFME